MTQETDQSYGLFKSKFRSNLRKLTKERLGSSETISFAPPWLIGMLVFGGKDPVTGHSLEDCFAQAFSKEKNLEAWAKVGAAPLTMACLSSHQVSHEAGDDGDPFFQVYKKIAKENDLACKLLNVQGFDGHNLRVHLKSTNLNRELTVPHSKEMIELLSTATTHGQKFLVTGGGHATSDDCFKAAELVNRKAEIEAMEKEKLRRVAAKKREIEAHSILLKRNHQ